MEHVVFSGLDGGGEEFRRVPSLEEAVRLVEHLRNDLGIEDSSVFALTPVPLAFRTYYRVEVPSELAATAPLPAPEPAAPEAAAVEAAAFDAAAYDALPFGDVEAEPDAMPIAVPSLLPDAAVLPMIPASREDDETEQHSLGYFSRG